MIHIHHFITRLAKLSDEEFHRCWLETRGPIANAINELRYVQSHRIRAVRHIGSASPYDAVAKVLVGSTDLS